jgi:nitric-oxide synthase
VYLGRQLAATAAAGARVRAGVPEEDAEKRRRRKEKRKALAKKTPSGVACCYGCGAPLHTGEEGSPGYVEPATYDLVIKHPSTGLNSLPL